MSCKQCRGITETFNDKSSRKQLTRFQRRGPDRTTQLLIDALRRVAESDGARSLTLLDIGAGIGAIHHALLDNLVSHVTHVDASPTQLALAREETGRRGHTGSVRFLEGDFTALDDQVAAADVVTLDRVICCFDDMEPLVGRSAARALRYYGAVYPRNIWWVRISMRAINGVQRLRRSPFRVFLHDPRAIDALLRSAGLAPWSETRTPAWQAVVYRRTR